MRHAIFLLAALTLGSSSMRSQEQRLPFDIQALMQVVRISEPHLSPNGKTVAFTVRSVDVADNAQPRHIYTADLDLPTPRQVTTEGSINERPRWSPDGKWLAWISNRDGGAQVWRMRPDGSEQTKLTSLATEASGVIWSPDSTQLLFVSEVYPDCPDDACNQKKLTAEKESKVKARVYTSLLYRHWNEWQGARRRHLFTVSVDGGTARDLMPAGTSDVPPFSLGGPDDYAISPDGREVCFAMHTGEQPATSTNWDLFTVPLAGGEIRRITSNPAADASPLYSPDGKYLSYRSQARAGYEADRWRLTLLDRATGIITYPADSIDRHVQSIAWTPDGQRIFFTLEDRGRTTLHLIAVTGGGTRQIIGANSHVDDVQLSADGKVMIYSEHSGSRPVEIFKASSNGGAAVPLTKLNAALLASRQLTAFEDFVVDGAEGARVQTFLLKPPNFDAKQKYPVLFLIHGGPQGAWGEAWSYRWNPQVLAAAGFVVAMPNPRGSTGYGQAFTDQITQDWGGKVYGDIMAVVDAVEKQPWADNERFAAAGGSYGGYMVNWILGHSNRFKALVSHAGVYDLRSMGGETEELWFTNWEFGGMPWQRPEVYEKWSPSNFVSDFRTPTLVIHGELDYRVPLGQGLQLFTALQIQKVPSKLLLFPDEGHWILKPQNSLLWYKSVIDWLREWTPPKAAK